MITPKYTVRQNHKFVYVDIIIPYKHPEFEIHFDKKIFIFHADPYFLEISLPVKVVLCNDLYTIGIHYDNAKEQYTFDLPKVNPGEFFERLDHITSLGAFLANNGPGSLQFSPRATVEVPRHQSDEKVEVLNQVAMTAEKKAFLESIQYYPTRIPHVKLWTIENVVDFFAFVGFEKEAIVFRQEEIDGKSLLLLSRDDVLTRLGLTFGKALKIFQHVEMLQFRCDPTRMR